MERSLILKTLKYDTHELIKTLQQKGKINEIYKDLEEDEDDDEE